MFKSKQVDAETNAVLVPAPMDHLDPLREHRFFCPWKNGAAQRNSGSKPTARGEEAKAGWEILVQVLKNDAFLRNRAAGGPKVAGHGRSKSTVVPQNVTPMTPGRPTTAGGGPAGSSFLGGGGDDDEQEDEATRAAKDKERWARLRKVKSLFNTKGGSRLKRAGSSRPGTSHSTAVGGAAGSGGT